MRFTTRPNPDTQGPPGADGSTWREGTGAPADGLGVNGDFYLDDATGDVYLKAAGTYSVVANIKGPPGLDGDDGLDGAPGSVWREGTGAPDNGLGVNGDFYLDDATGDVYLKAAGSYSVVANIKGPPGAAGQSVAVADEPEVLVISPATRVQFKTADGFTVTEPSAGVAEVGFTGGAQAKVDALVMAGGL